MAHQFILKSSKKQRVMTLLKKWFKRHGKHGSTIDIYKEIERRKLEIMLKNHAFRLYLGVR